MAPLTVAKMFVAFAICTDCLRKEWFILQGLLLVEWVLFCGGKPECDFWRYLLHSYKLHKLQKGLFYPYMEKTHRT